MIRFCDTLVERLERSVITSIVWSNHTVHLGVLMVTVIIPVFNRIKTLKRCVDSVLVQTYSDLDIILVDDGSTDSSIKMCDEYRMADSRIQVVNGCHQGVAYARNQGIRNAKGEYITFIDSDDYVAPDYVEKLVDAFESNDCVLSMCNSYKVKDGKSTKQRLPAKSLCLVKDYLDDTFYDRIEGGSCWGKLYKTSDIKHAFREFNFCEDIFYVFEFLAEKEGYVAVVPDVLYHYVRHEESITGAKKAEDLKDILPSCEGIRRTCQDKYTAYIDSSTALLVNNAFFVYLNSKKNVSSQVDELRAESVRIIKQYRGCVIRDHRATFKTKSACLLSYISFGLVSFVYGLI